MEEDIQNYSTTVMFRGTPCSYLNTLMSETKKNIRWPKPLLTALKGPGVTVQSGTGKIDPARKLKCTKGARVQP